MVHHSLNVVFVADRNGIEEIQVSVNQRRGCHVTSAPNSLRGCDGTARYYAKKIHNQRADFRQRYHALLHLNDVAERLLETAINKLA